MFGARPGCWAMSVRARARQAISPGWLGAAQSRLVVALVVAVAGAPECAAVVSAAVGPGAVTSSPAVAMARAGRVARSLRALGRRGLPGDVKRKVRPSVGMRARPVPALGVLAGTGLGPVLTDRGMCGPAPAGGRGPAWCLRWTGVGAPRCRFRWHDRTCHAGDRTTRAVGLANWCGHDVTDGSSAASRWCSQPLPGFAQEMPKG